MNIGKYAQKLYIGTAVKRWPIASVLSAITTGVVLVWIFEDHLEQQRHQQYARMVMSLYTGFLVAIVTALGIKDRLGVLQRQIVIALMAILAMIVCYSMLPELYLGPRYETHRVQYAYPLMILALHLVISYIAFIKQDSNPATFWRWNIHVFRVFLEGLLYAAILMTGLSMALLALRYLFGLDIEDESYAYIAAVLVGFFHPWFVLSKTYVVPQLTLLPESNKGFEILTTYVLIPITVLYMVILYLYGGKLLLEWTLPYGWLGKLSLSFCAVAVLTFLFNDQLVKPNGGHINTLFQRWCPLILILPIGLLLIAVYTRINMYGITEMRYMVASLAIWLLGIALAYTLCKNIGIRWIPISLSIIMCLLLVSGPFNLFNITIRSQSNRLGHMLSESQLLIDGMLHPPSDSSTDLPSQSIASLIYFLDNRTPLNNLDLWHNEDILWSQDSHAQADTLIAYLHIDSPFNHNYNPDSHIYYRKNNIDNINLSPYDKAYFFSSYSEEGGDPIAFVSKDQRHLSLRLEETNLDISAIDIGLAYDDKVNNSHNSPITLTLDLDEYHKVYFTEIQLRIVGSSYIIDQCAGLLLVRQK